MAKKMLSCFMAVLLSFAAFEAPALTAPPEAYAAEAPTYGFTDVNGDEWFAIDEVLGYATDHGIISGYDDGRLGAYDDVTRGQVAVILHRLAGEPDAQADDFADVDYGAYYGPAIRWARSTGVINGYWDEAAQAYLSFGPDDPVTREQLATMLANYAREIEAIVTETDGVLLNGMPDAGDVDGWARESVGWAMDAGLMSGVVEAGGSYVRPLATAQRCAMAKMASALHRDVLPPEINPDAEPIIEYSEDVVTAPAANASISEDGLTASIPAESLSEPIQQGDVVVVSDDGITGTAILANAVTTDGSRTIVTGTQPSLEQVYKQLSIEDILDGDDMTCDPCNGFEIVESDDQDLSWIEKGEIDPDPIGESITLKYKGDLIPGTIEVSLSPKVEYKVEYNFGSLDLAYVDLKTTASVKGTLDGEIDKTITVARLNYGAIEITLNLVAKATGELSLECKPTFNSGFIYKNDKCEFIKKAEFPRAQIDFEANAELGPSLRAAVGFLNLGCLYAQVAGGAEAEASVSTHPNLMCVSVDGWLFADAEVGLDGILIDAIPGDFELCKPMPIITKDNSPVRKSWHLENWKLTDKCSWSDGDDSGGDGGDDSGSEDDTGGATILESGECGSCIWTIDSNGVFTVAPKNGFIGYLEDYTFPPWNPAKNPIKAAVIKGGVRARNCSHFFFNMQEMETVDLSGLDTSRVQSMSEMFFACFSLKTVDISNLDTSQVRYMDNMFFYCNSMTTADMSGIDTSQVEDICGMFDSCLSLTTIYASNNFAPNIDRADKSVSVFGDCDKLIGGNGTVFSRDHLYSDYATIDEPGSPGYFTLKL